MLRAGLAWFPWAASAPADLQGAVALVLRPQRGRAGGAGSDSGVRQRSKLYGMV